MADLLNLCLTAGNLPDLTHAYIDFGDTAKSSVRFGSDEHEGVRRTTTIELERGVKEVL
jgi:hypothetical protein